MNAQPMMSQFALSLFLFDLVFEGRASIKFFSVNLNLPCKNYVQDEWGTRFLKCSTFTTNRANCYINVNLYEI